jgi:hypothetical protein
MSYPYPILEYVNYVNSSYQNPETRIFGFHKMAIPRDPLFTHGTPAGSLEKPVNKSSVWVG